MSNPKHTPGPWNPHKNQAGILSEEWIIQSEYGQIIARTPYDSPEDRMNAALIAAAPELLAALQGIVESIHSVDGGCPHVNFWQKDIERLKGLIQKASGESP